MRTFDDEDTFDIPMTSLIDLVFTLLLFFLVATNFVRREMDHAILLPDSEAGVKITNIPERIVINVRENAVMVVNGRITTETELRSMVADFSAAHPERPAVIRADGRVRYEAVMKVFGICRAGGVQHVDLPVMEPGWKNGK